MCESCMTAVENSTKEICVNLCDTNHSEASWFEPKLVSLPEHIMSRWVSGDSAPCWESERMQF